MRVSHLLFTQRLISRVQLLLERLRVRPQSRHLLIGLPLPFFEHSAQAVLLAARFFSEGFDRGELLLRLPAGVRPVFVSEPYAGVISFRADPRPKIKRSLSFGFVRLF